MTTSSRLASAQKTGRLAERLGTKNTLFVGLSFGLVGLFSLVYATNVESLSGIAVSIGFVGAGIGTVMGPTQAAALTAVDPSQSGVAAGVLSTMASMLWPRQ